MMIKDSEFLEEFERKLQQSTPVDLEKNFRILNWLYEEARSLGVFPPEDPLEGIETDIKLAGILNSVRKTP